MSLKSKCSDLSTVGILCGFPRFNKSTVKVIYPPTVYSTVSRLERDARLSVRLLKFNVNTLGINNDPKII